MPTQAQRARDILESFGAALLAEHPGQGVAEYELLTDAGRLVLSVQRDVVVCLFDRPARAAPLVGCPASGQWSVRIDGVAGTALLSETLAGLGARAMERTEVPVTPAWVDAQDLDSMRDRVSDGEDFVVGGFDRGAAARALHAAMESGVLDRFEARMLIGTVLRATHLDAYVTARDAGVLPGPPLDSASPSP